MIYKKLNKPELTLIIIISIFIFLFYFFFNFNYLSNWIDEKGDVKTYDYYVRLGIPQYLFNPHHIAFDWLGKKLYNIFKNNGYTGPTMLILQIRNLIISSAGLSLFFFLFYKISKKLILSLLIVLLIAFSCAYWIYSQINDTPIIHSILLALLFFAVIYFPQSKNKLLFSIFLGLLHAVCIFFHQSNVLFIFVIIFVILFAEKLNLRSNNNEDYFSFQIQYEKKNNLNSQNLSFINSFNILYLLVYLSTFFIIVIITYYYVGIVLLGLSLNPNEVNSFNEIKESSYFFNWLILYAKIDYWGKGYESNTFINAVKGISTYFYQPQSFNNKELILDLKNFFAANSLLPNLLAFFVASIISTSLIFMVKMYKKYKYIFIANVIFLILYIIFACWWEPDYREFWVAPMFSFWFLAFFVLNLIIDSSKKINPLPKLFIYFYIFLIILLLFYFNFIGFLYPNASKNFKKFDIVKSIHNDANNLIIKPKQNPASYLQNTNVNNIKSN